MTLVALALIAAAPGVPPAAPAEPVATPREIVSIFSRFCLDTGGDRARFDAAVAAATGLRKVSHPSLFSGVEFNRRWAVGAAELAFLDAPSPAGRSCGVNASARGGFDGAGFVALAAEATGLAFEERERTPSFGRWLSRTADGDLVIINSRAGGVFGDVEIILIPGGLPE